MAAETQALVVGAGPAGLVAAATLARSGIRCRIVDRADEPARYSQAVVVHCRTLEVLQDLGVADDLIACGQSVHRLNVNALRKRIVRLAFDWPDTPYPFVLVVPQSDTERILNDLLAKLGIEVERGVKLTSLEPAEDEVTAVLERSGTEREVARVPWLIGCDGGGSTVRSELGIPFQGAAYPETFVLADATLDTDLPRDQSHIYLGQGFIGIFPLSDREWRVFATRPTGDDRCDPPTAEEMQTLLDDRGPGGITIQDTTWLSAFRLQRRMVPHMRSGRVFLAGDAAHVHSPAGGQGMNLGMQDAYNLGWKLSLSILGEASESLLDSYEPERHPAAAATLRLTDRATRVIEMRNPRAWRVAQTVAPRVSSLSKVQTKIRGTFMQVAVNYRDSPIVDEDWSSAKLPLGPRRSGRLGTGPRPGDRAPDGTLVEPGTSAEVSLFNVIGGGRHHLLLFEGPRPGGTAELDEIRRAISDAYGERVRVVLISPSSVSPPFSWAGDLLIDEKGEIAGRYAVSSPCLYLIRPDGYVGFRSRPPRASSLLDHMRLTFGPLDPTGTPAA